MVQRPSVVGRKIVKFVFMALGLGVTGAIFGLLGALIGGKVLGGDSPGFGALGLALAGIIIGYPTGIIVGIVLIKKILHQRGSLVLAVLGSIMDAAIIMALADPLHLNSNSGLLFGVFFVGVPVFGLGGFLLRK